jgi:outer membrane receptor protein involved in Fe transport
VTFSGSIFTASVVGKYVGSFYTDNFKNEANKNDDYLVFNAETVHRLSGFGMTLRGEVRNIFNRLYLMSGEGNAFFPAAERNYILGLTVQI